MSGSREKKDGVWFVIQFQEFNEGNGETQVFYSAIPGNWISYEENRAVVNWSSAKNASKQIMLGNPPTEPTTPYTCKILSKFSSYQEAATEERLIFNRKKDKKDLTTDFESSDEDYPNAKGNSNGDFNKKAEDLLNNTPAPLPDMLLTTPAPSKDNPQMSPVDGSTKQIPGTSSETSKQQEASLTTATGQILQKDIENIDLLGNMDGSPLHIFDLPEMSFGQLKAAIDQNTEKINMLLQVSLENKALLLRLTENSTGTTHMDKADAVANLIAGNIHIPIKEHDSLRILEQKLAAKDQNITRAFVSVIAIIRTYSNSCFSFTEIVCLQFHIICLSIKTKLQIGNRFII